MSKARACPQGHTISLIVLFFLLPCNVKCNLKCPAVQHDRVWIMSQELLGVVGFNCFGVNWIKEILLTGPEGWADIFIWVRHMHLTKNLRIKGIWTEQNDEDRLSEVRAQCSTSNWLWKHKWGSGTGGTGLNKETHQRYCTKNAQQKEGIKWGTVQAGHVLECKAISVKSLEKP